MTVDEQLAREESGRRLAAAAAVVGALLYLGGGLLGVAAYAENPNNSIGHVLYLHEHNSKLLLAAVLSGVGALGAGYALRFLLDATRARRPETPSIARICVTFAPPLFLVGSVGYQIALGSSASDFVNGAVQTFDRADDAQRSTASLILGGVQTASLLALAFAFVLTSLNAMRVGLLTRFTGYIGIIAGVLLVLPLFGPPVIQAFWLLTLAALFLGRWPSGVPPAWTSGKAEPWPSQQDLREQREQGLARHQEGRDEPELEAAAEAEHATPAHSSSKKRKRKKRR